MSSTQHRILLIVVALLIVGALLFAVRTAGVESHSAPQADDSPEACIARLLSAEERGDSRAYLECFTDPQQRKLEITWQGRAPSQIATELRSQFAGLVGRATTDLKFADPDHAGLVLERIKEDHTERQQVILIREGGRWQIESLSKPDWQAPAIPYGTPVFAPR